MAEENLTLAVIDNPVFILYPTLNGYQDQYVKSISFLLILLANLSKVNGNLTFLTKGMQKS